MKFKTKKNLQLVVLILLLVLYLGYVFFVIKIDQGPVDYETFMQIGGRFLAGQEVYGENSYYPMPFVLIFAFFAQLPRPISMALWLLLPVMTALMISGWKPWVLLFAPLFGYFVGGQSVLFGLLGYWGYRKKRKTDKTGTGLWLAMTLLNPQMAVIPTGFAFYQWWKLWQTERRISRQTIGWLSGVAVLFLPAFIIWPDWVGRWLTSPRPLALRAMAGLIPRGLALTVGEGWLFWVLWLVMSVSLLIWLLRKGGMTLDRWMLWYFIASPLVHDYDIFQLIPQFEDATTRNLAVILSAPLWVVLLYFNNNDQAWFVVTLIAPGLLIFEMLKKKPEKLAVT